MTKRIEIDDPRVVSALRSSLVVAAVAGLIEALWRAAGQSRAAAGVAAAKSHWGAVGVTGQRRVIGVVLVVAALVGLALTSATDHPAGWLWIVPPAIAASVGMVFLVAATAAGAE